MMDEEHERIPSATGDSNAFTLGQLSGHNVVAASLPVGHQGKVSAAIVASSISKLFPSISLRLLVGTGGGIPSEKHDIRLGDIVISTPSGDKGGVVGYDLGNSTIMGFQRKGYLCPPPVEWLTILPQMQSDHRIHGSNIHQFISDTLDRYPHMSEYSRPPDSTDVLFNSKTHHKYRETTCKDCDKEQIVERPMRKNSKVPQLHYGLIASGDQVIKNASKREKISESLDDLLCFEMEAAGLMNDFRCIVIRGISNYADSHKNDLWQAYAAAAAAGVAKELLGYKDSTIEKFAAPADIFEVIKSVYPAQDLLQYFANIRGEFTNGRMLYQPENYPSLAAEGPISNSKQRPKSMEDERRPGL